MVNIYLRSINDIDDYKMVRCAYHANIRASGSCGLGVVVLVCDRKIIFAETLKL